jgi:hypothetical protein
MGWIRSPRHNRKPVRRPIRRAARPAVEHLEPRLAPSVDLLNWRGNVTTGPNANNSGANLHETQLTPANVNPSTFGVQFVYPVDGQMYAEPLVKTNVAIAGKGTHNVVFAATENDSVYAFDADTFGGANTAPLWKTSFLTSGLPGATSITPVPSSVTGSADITPIIGITATPTIDPSTNTLYVVSKTAEVVGGVTHYVQRLHALDIGSGAEKLGGPVLVGDTTFNGPDGGFTDHSPIMVPGTGDSSDGTMVHFNALRENERDGLFLANGVLYLTFTSHGDTQPYHGWLAGYNPATLQLESVYNATPNGTEGAVWMGGGQPAVDSSGNIYFATGNGTFDAASGGVHALGGGGGALGYQGIGNSVAVTLRAFNPSTQIGLGVDGAFQGQVPITGMDFNAAAQASTPDTFQVMLHYDGTTLSATITDLTTSVTFNAPSQTINIPQIVGGNTAWVGFTGGTGGLNVEQDVNTWTYATGGTTVINHAAGFAGASDLTTNGSSTLFGSAAQITQAQNGEAGSIFETNQVNVTNFTTTFTFQMKAGTNPIADGMTFTIQNATPGPDYAMSIEKVSPTPGAGNQLPVLSFFTPHDEAPLSNVDLDQGSGGVLLLPDQTVNGQTLHLLVQTGKTGRIYLLNRDNLGGFTATDSGAVQVLPDGTIGGEGSYDTPAYFNNGAQQLIYYLGAGDVLKSFSLSNGLLSTQPFATASQAFGFPGANPFISANGTTNGIVWALETSNNGTGGHPASAPAVLHAYDATTLHELYNSSINGTLDQLGNAVKFTVPTVVNGHVYVGTQSGLYVFGLFPPPTTKPAAPANLTITGDTANSVSLSWTNNATNARGIRVLRSTGNASNFVQIAEVSPFTTTFTDKTVSPANKYFYEVVATNSLGDSGPSNKVNVLLPAGAPTLSITGIGSSQVNLAWAPTAGTTFNVLRSSDGGVTFSLIATVPASVTTFVDTGLAPGVYSYEVQAFDQFGNTPLSNVVTVTVGEPVVVDHSGGFANHNDLTANGTTTFPSGVAQLTDGGGGETGTFFSDQKTDIRSFTTTFTIQMHNGSSPMADGMTFIIQPNSPTELVADGGGGLGYGADNFVSAGGAVGMPNSVAVKFDLFNNRGEGFDSTGIFSDGRSPTLRDPALPATPTPLVPDQSVDMSSTGIQLQSGDVFQVTLTYDGTTLTETITDETLASHPSFSTSYAVNIPGILGTDTAFVGFGGATGGLTTVATVQSWKFTPTTQNLAPLSPTNLQVASVVPHDANRNDITITWTTNSFNETGYEVWRSTNGTTFSLLATLPPNSMSFTDSSLGAGTYYYKVRAFNANGDSLFTNVDSVITATPGATATVDHSGGFSSNGDLTANGAATFTPNATPVGIFAGHQDVGTQGDPSPAGSATFSNTNGGTYTLTASGSDIWTNADHMQYVYERLTGDGSIVARLVSATAPDFWTKAGVMIRDSLDAGAADDFMLDTPNPSHQEPVMQFRDSDGGQTSDTGNHVGATNPTPIWLRLDRVGNTFTGYWAVDNNGTPGTWQLIAQNDPHTTAMPATVYVGLALTAHSNGNVATAVFDHVTVTGTTAPLPPAVARLTDGGGSEAGSVFTTSRVGVTNFSTTFTFRMHDGTAPNMADGMAFVIQANSPQALGGGGGALGYQGIPNSIAVKFDLFSNAGEGTDSTGLYLNGASPTVPAIDMTPSGVILQSQDVMQATLTYDGTTLTETVTDETLASHPTFTTSYRVDIPSVIGTSLGYVGFSGGTGGLTTVADVQTWTYQFTEATPGGGGSPSGAAPALAGSGAGTASPALAAPAPFFTGSGPAGPASLGGASSTGAAVPAVTSGTSPVAPGIDPAGVFRVSIGGTGAVGSAQSVATASDGATAGGPALPVSDLVFGNPNLLKTLGGGTVDVPTDGSAPATDSVFGQADLFPVL